METFEAHQERTGAFMQRRQLSGLLGTPLGKHGLTDAEMEAVARRDLGCSRRNTYRDLGRGGVTGMLGGNGRQRRPIHVPYESAGGGETRA